MRDLIERNLQKHPGFQSDLRVAVDLDYRGDGLFHDNYVFNTGKNWFVLRLAKRWGALRSQAEAISSLRREAETLRRLSETNFPFPVPKMVCEVSDDSGEPIGLIETYLEGIPLVNRSGIRFRDPLMAVAQVAAAVHQLPTTQFSHLPVSQESGAHVTERLAELPDDIVKASPVASLGTEWIRKNLPRDRPSVVLHGDLLPQNLLGWPGAGEERLSVIDWETARIGDPAYDLAIVTRGARNPLKQPNGLRMMVAAYNELRGTDLPVSAVQIHELLMNLSWLCEATEQQRTGKQEGHGPDFYEQAIAAILRRVV